MEEKNNLDWKLYEDITKYIYETLGKQYNITIEGYGHSCKIIGASGVSHQIDVLTSESDGLKTYQTAIECKYLKKKVDKDVVMKLRSIMDDCNIQRGIIVSRSGFTPDAKKFAEHKAVKIVQLREVSEKDQDIQKEVKIADIDFFIHTTIHRPQITKIIGKTIDNQDLLLLEQNQYSILLKNENGNQIRFLDLIMEFKDFLHGQTPFKISSKSYAYQGYKLEIDEAKYDIENISFTGLLTIIDNHQKTVFSLIDHVWLIMEQIFENQIFVISDYGLIIHNKI
ncbi:restriction endonuclease [Chryseobacterium aahli]|uniref:restriction endonuclease n=1 Tax=Chryseobacterium aahli TaxID=1278643 RepID=UPI001F603CD3|nr:restriction endonuclease [Chryseobacterium aahli]MCI3938591.1 restriction endonuclease [Chryseobacterium aahli]